jgi:hypothetical protein
VEWQEALSDRIWRCYSSRMGFEKCFFLTANWNHQIWLALWVTYKIR